MYVKVREVIVIPPQYILYILCKPKIMIAVEFKIKRFDISLKNYFTFLPLLNV